MRLSHRSFSRYYSVLEPLNLIAPLYLSALFTLCLWLVQPSFSMVFPNFGIGLLALGIAVTLYKWRHRTTLTYLWGMCSALIGISLGSYIDFGLFDMKVLYEICGQGNMLSIAPFTFMGMILGCNHGMIISANSKLSVINLVYCNVGMLFGMLMFDVSGINTLLTSESLNIAVHAFFMIFFGHFFYTFSESTHYKSIYFKLTDYLRAS